MHRNPRSTRRIAGGFALAVALGALTSGIVPAQAAFRRAGPVTWRADLSGPAGTSAYGVVRDGTALTLAPAAPAVASLRSPARTGSYTLPPRQLGKSVNRVSAKVDAVANRDSAVLVLVRGRATDGRWTEWRQAEQQGGRDAAGRPGDREMAVLPARSTQIQVRVELTGGSARTAVPRVSGLVLTADQGGDTQARPAKPGAAAATYQLFATREGLVGGTTANGHVIVERDHFVALPSRRALNPNDGTRDFQVQVCYPVTGRCETAPVWDIGPWNTRDDYWNPAAEREMWQDLPQGVPEAQAAYLDGYNGGLDEFGRQVLNPAGIDLADGTFWDGLGMSNNDWVEVTFLWTAR